ncbi:MAG TPA: peptidylprolyl isomerase, partial [Usitatibacter sp.]
MQRTLRNLAVALVAGTFAVAAGAQDKAEKAPRKSAATSSSGKVVVNGVTIPQSRIDAMNRELTAQGQPDTPERKQAVTEELVNREVLAQAAQKRGLDKNPDIVAQMDMARQAVLVRALFEEEVKKSPITDAQLQQQYEQFKGSMGT